MFSLIITLISIALVAALALATLYYGGPVFNQGASRAHAAKIAAQGQQIQGAAELFKADTGAYPETLDDLVAQDYLKSIPVAAAQEQVLINNALAATAWEMVAPYTPVFAVTGVSEAVCKAVNLGSYGVEGILKSARQSNRVQCYGTSTGSLMIVQAKSPADLVAASTNPDAVLSLGAVLAAPVPSADSSDASDAGWLVAPGTDTSVVTPPGTPELEFQDSEESPQYMLGFPYTSVGQTSPADRVVVRNIGTAAITMTSQGAVVPAPFVEVADTCASATLAPEASCFVDVAFAPTAAISYSNQGYAVTLSAVGATVTPTLGLSGTGGAAGFYPDMFRYAADTNQVFKQTESQRVTNPYNSYESGSGYEWLAAGFEHFTPSEGSLQLQFWVEYNDTVYGQRSTATGLAANPLVLSAENYTCFTYNGSTTTPLACPVDATFPILATVPAPPK